MVIAFLQPSFLADMVASWK